MILTIFTRRDVYLIIIYETLKLYYDSNQIQWDKYEKNI